MASGIGVLVAERIAVALVEDHKVVSSLQTYPTDDREPEALLGMPAELIIEKIVDVAQPLVTADKPTCVGVGFPGIVRNGTIEDSPNLVQLKGQPMQALLETAFARVTGNLPVSIFNDADVVAAGCGARRGRL